MSEISKAQQKKSVELRDKLAEDFNEQEAEEFASEHQDSSWYDDFVLLLKMMTTDGYSISNKTKLIIAGTLAYVVLPIDVIPDFIPVVGWLDDAFVLGLAMTTLKDEIEKFKQFMEA
jgi:uncharacterized membrane protein YkvA (DUF1232 family)